MKSLLLLSVLCLFPALGRAQVIIHQAALDQLAGIAPAAPVVVSPPTAAIRPVRHVFRRRHRVSTPITMAFRSPPVPASPAAPANKTLAAKPVPAVARPAPPPVVALQFAPGSSDLPPNAAAALKPLCAAAEPSGMVGIDAGAGGGDPSTAMRLAMARAFAVRNALTACGISPARIIPRASAPGAGGDIARVTLGQ